MNNVTVTLGEKLFEHILPSVQIVLGVLLAITGLFGINHTRKRQALGDVDAGGLPLLAFCYAFIFGCSGTLLGVALLVLR